MHNYDDYFLRLTVVYLSISLQHLHHDYNYFAPSYKLQFFSVDSDPLQSTSSIQICPDPGPKWALLCAATASPQPSSLHTTAASLISHASWHTVPHFPLGRTSTLPAQRLPPSTKLTMHVQQTQRDRECDRERERTGEKQHTPRHTPAHTERHGHEALGELIGK